MVGKNSSPVNLLILVQRCFVYTDLSVNTDQYHCLIIYGHLPEKKREENIVLFSQAIINIIILEKWKNQMCDDNICKYGAITWISISFWSVSI